MTATRPKTGGRQKGTPNKKTALEKKGIEEKLKEMDYDPIVEMVEIGKEARINGDLSLAFNTSKELAQYVASKRKAVEHKIEIVGGNPIDLEIFNEIIADE